MARAGRDLELLVETLETLLSDSPVVVKSPDYIAGKYSGNPREVDVSLRARVGSTEILVILECRDRDDTEDVRWIEQLVGKRDEVGANKVIAVSSTGFTSGARSMADALGIELRTLGDVDLSAVSDWLDIEFLVLRVYTPVFHHTTINVADSTPPELAQEIAGTLSDLLSTTPVLVRTQDGAPASVNEVWRQASFAGDLWRLPVGIPKRGTFFVVAKDGNAPYALRSSAGLVPVYEIIIDVTVTATERLVPISRYEYVDGERVLAQGVRAEVAHEGALIKFNLARGGSKLVLTAESDSPAALTGLETNLLLQVGDGAPGSPCEPFREE